MMSCDYPTSYDRTCATHPWLQTNTGYVPTLRILNSKNKTMRIWREGIPDGVIINPGATEQLQPGDKVDIVSGLPLTYVSTLHHSCHATNLIVAPQNTMAENMLLRDTWKSQRLNPPRRLCIPRCACPQVSSLRRSSPLNFIYSS
jgi:hypothetical protein